MPDSECLDGWTGLLIETDSAAEIEYLDDMPACQNELGTATYLKNDSDAVWVLTSKGDQGSWTPRKLDLTQASFLEATSGERPGATVLAPKEDGWVNLPPRMVEWNIDLPLSFGWEAHDLVTGKIASAGGDAGVLALRKKGPGRAALLRCTLAVTTVANTIDDLEEADASEILISGLGSTAAASACQREAASVPVVDRAGNRFALSSDLKQLGRQTEVLEKAHGRLELAQVASKALKLGIKVASS